jgi:hypothetical protein
LGQHKSPSSSPPFIAAISKLYHTVAKTKIDLRLNRTSPSLEKAESNSLGLRPSGSIIRLAPNHPTKYPIWPAPDGS